MFKVRSRGGPLAALAGAALLLGSMLPASANLTGAIFTTQNTATAVNQNLYTNKNDVYLNGGPQNVNSNGLPAGTYFFQVTTPSGNLLSTDDVRNRRVLVSLVNGKGVISGPLADPIDPVTYPGHQPPGTQNSITGAIPVQLAPYNDSPNGEYKVWLSPDPTFPNSESKTDNFRINAVPTQTEFTGLKYRDNDINGVLGANDPPIPGWTIQLKKLNTNSGMYELVESTNTDGDGAYQFLVPSDGASYIICEVQQAGWTQEGPIPGAVPVVGGVNQSYGVADASQCWDVQAANGVNATDSGLDFGNIPSVRIGGAKYNDANMNGTRDMNEGLITNPVFTIKVVATLPDAAHTVLTNTYPTTGGVWTSNLYPAGTTFVATEINVPAGWQNTGGAAGYTGTVGDTATTGLDFGNIQLARITGVKFNDANVNGTQDGMEALIPNTTATFTFHVVATLPNGTVSTKDYTNDATGHWQSDLYPVGTTFVVTEINVPTGWANTGGTAGYTGTVTATTVTGLDFGNVQTAPIGGVKYYDANTNGQKDGNEVLIPSSAATFTFHVVATLPNGTVVTKDYTNDATGHWQSDPYPIGTTFVVTEINVPSGWVNTGGTAGYTGTVDATNTALNFGNVRLGAGGGLTLGFWSNKNGQALIGADDLAMLVALNLRNGDGSNFDPPSNTTFRTWILSATATNMAYMLSAQLAAMELNVFNNKVNGGSLIYAPGTNSANAQGFATVNAVMAEANALLGANVTNLTILSGDPLRARAEALKTALDQANNNLTFVQPFP